MEGVEMDDIGKLPYGDEEDEYYEVETGFDEPDKETKLFRKFRDERVKRKRQGYLKTSSLRERFMETSFGIAKRKLINQHINFVIKIFKGLDLEEDIADRPFVKYLMKNDYLVTNSEINNEMLYHKYVLHYEGTIVITEEMSQEDVNLLRSNVRAIYDKYVEINNEKLMKKYGAIAGVVIGIITLVTGLSVGLTRKGNDLVHQSKQWEKLKPSSRKKSTAWTDLTDATGRSLVFTGKYFTVMVVIAIGYLTVKKR